MKALHLVLAIACKILGGCASPRSVHSESCPIVGKTLLESNTVVSGYLEYAAQGYYSVFGRSIWALKVEDRLILIPDYDQKPASEIRKCSLHGDLYKVTFRATEQAARFYRKARKINASMPPPPINGVFEYLVLEMSHMPH